MRGQVKECAKSRASCWEGRWGSAIATTATPWVRRWYKFTRCSLPIIPTPMIPYFTTIAPAMDSDFWILILLQLLGLFWLVVQNLVIRVIEDISSIDCSLSDKFSHVSSQLHIFFGIVFSLFVFNFIYWSVFEKNLIRIVWHNTSSCMRNLFIWMVVKFKIFLFFIKWYIPGDWIHEN